MGTINFNSSDYITLSIKPYDIDDFLSDGDLIECAKYNGYITDDEIRQYCYDEISACYDCDMENIKEILSRYHFNYYDVSIEYGYYESFSLAIKNKRGNDCFSCYDSYLDKIAAQKELTQLKKMLYECAGCGMVETWSGWCTKYFDYNHTIQSINEAIKDARKEIKTLPTTQYFLRHPQEI